MVEWEGMVFCAAPLRLHPGKNPTRTVGCRLFTSVGFRWTKRGLFSLSSHSIRPPLPAVICLSRWFDMAPTSISVLLPTAGCRPRVAMQSPACSCVWFGTAGASATAAVRVKLRTVASPSRGRMQDVQTSMFFREWGLEGGFLPKSQVDLKTLVILQTRRKRASASRHRHLFFHCRRSHKSYVCQYRVIPSATSLHLGIQCAATGCVLAWASRPRSWSGGPRRV